MLRILRALALAVTFVIAVPATGLGQMLFYCTMTGKIGTDCCCTPENRAKMAKMMAMHHQKSTTTTKAAKKDLLKADMQLSRRTSCCEVIAGHEHYTHNWLETFNPELHTTVATLPKVYFPFPEMTGAIISRNVVPVGVRGPPPGLHPPIYKRNCSYLN